MGELAGGGSVALAVNTLTCLLCERLHVTGDMWNLTHDFFVCQKELKSANTCLKVHKSAKNDTKCKKEGKYGRISSYWCYYPDKLRDSVFPVCRIFF